MNLREIDRLVAEKVMKWRLKSFAGAGGGFTAWINDKGEIIKYENDCTLQIQPNSEEFWRPTINIVDALQVAEKWRLYEIHKVDDKYICWIYDESNKEANFYEAEAKSLPLAICLTALKVVGSEVEINERN